LRKNKGLDRYDDSEISHNDLEEARIVARYKRSLCPRTCLFLGGQIGDNIGAVFGL
jgi:hypothetical protein